MQAPNILTDLLTLLGVPHTYGYSVSRFDAMPFKTLFGLKSLLRDYKVDSEGIMLADKEKIGELPVPFIAGSSHGLVIVTSTGADSVEYMTQGVTERMPRGAFLQAWDGMAFIASPQDGASEPGYGSHRLALVMAKLRDIGLVTGIVLLFVYLFVSNRIYASWSQILLTVFDLAGLTFSFMLVQKTLNIHTRAADRVCGVLEEGGCDTVLKNTASTFFGIFHWSEVGLAYFSVSLLTLLVFPQFTGYLAAVNLCCLPYTLWSIWYQKLRAKAWCTLCVSVQTTLWLLFACYLGGGWYRDIFPIRIEFFVLLLTYGTVLFALNRLSPYFERKED